MKEHDHSDDGLLWYKDAIIYELHIKAYRDSNSDGIGDINGLLEKLDHLIELGVTAIWLLPFYPSPLKDDGYDIADYYSIHSSYGDIPQFRHLLIEAHKRGIKVITELVINHTSDQHPWFLRARKAPKYSAERNFYVWSDDPNKYNDVRIIFQDFEKSNWSWDEEAQQYYWHRFFHHQPDLNFDNPEVQDEVFSIIDFWCKLGVDGFRLDAVPYLFEREDTNSENLPETHTFLKKLRAHVENNYPGTLLLAEANMWPEDAVAYFGEGDECQMNYHFPLMPRMFMAIQMEDRHPITDIFDQTPVIPDSCQWAVFLRNHDELTLEMVTDEERDYMYKTYAKNPKARINLGIRHRLAPLMENDRRKIELMNALLFSLPGTPVIYYGDEIGMGDNFYLGDRDGVRTPMQWSPDRNAGFSLANPQHLYLPLILDPLYHFETLNVENQRANTSSLFWYMKRIISIRKRHMVFGRGDINFMTTENSKVLAFTRSYKDETILIIANLSKFSQPAEIDLEEYNGYTPLEMFGKNNFPAVTKDAPYFFTLAPYSYQWFILQPGISDNKNIVIDSALELEQWEEILNDGIRKTLERIIVPKYLSKTNWFQGNIDLIYECSIRHHHMMMAGDKKIFLLLLEIHYKTGLPEKYQLPVAFLRNEESILIRQTPQAIITEIKLPGDECGILCDAYFVRDFQELLIRNLIDGENPTSNSPFIFSRNKSIQNTIPGNMKYNARVHTAAGQSNSALVYGHEFFLKLYRKVEIGPHPDQELSRFLSETSQFPFTPLYLGSIEWKIDRQKIPIGMLQNLLEKYGDGNIYMKERVHNFIDRVVALPNHDKKNIETSENLRIPLSIDNLSEEYQNLIGERATSQISLMGRRVAELHIALSKSDLKEFAPEPFTLHYQRSLYSAFKSSLESAFSNLAKYKKTIPPNFQCEVMKLIQSKDEFEAKLKYIYQKRINTLKIRIHGNLNLSQMLLTGRDISIHDFGGDPARSLSERRLKRSPLRDVASMIQSIFYCSYSAYLENLPETEQSFELLPFVNIWSNHMSRLFLSSYLDTKGIDLLIPAKKEDIISLLELYLLEKCFHAIKLQKHKDPKFLIIPIKIIELVRS